MAKLSSWASHEMREVSAKAQILRTTGTVSWSILQLAWAKCHVGDRTNRPFTVRVEKLGPPATPPSSGNSCGPLGLCLRFLGRPSCPVVTEIFTPNYMVPLLGKKKRTWLAPLVMFFREFKHIRHAIHFFRGNITQYMVRHNSRTLMA